MARELSSTLKLTTVWLLLATVLFLGVQWWQARELTTRFQANEQSIEIRRGRDGHYHWPGRINGREVDFLVDTGATTTAIPAALARELGLDSLGKVRSKTANGETVGEIVRADIELQGGVRSERLRVVALPGLGPAPLLGMDVLGRLRFSQSDGVLRFQSQ